MGPIDSIGFRMILLVVVLAGIAPGCSDTEQAGNPEETPRVAAPVAALSEQAAEGKRLYHRYACHSCHGQTGSGVGDLRHANERYPTDEALIAYIKHPARTYPETKMPEWDGLIADEDYAPLVAYVRWLARQGATTGD